MKRIKFPRYVPKGAAALKPKGFEAVAYLYQVERNGKLKYVVLAYGGKRSKPDFHYNYPSNEARAAAIESWIRGMKQSEELKAKRREERSKPHQLKVGQVLYSSWGYDQTNIDFYEVVEIPGPNSVMIRELEQMQGGYSGHPSSDLVVPHVGKYKGEAMLKRASADGYVRIASYASASPWNGEAKHQTGFGYGH